MNSKKRSSKNLKITTRITIAAVIGIIVPLIIILVFSSVFPAVMAQYFGFSSVTTNSYSMLNQIQWSQELSQITNELVSPEELKRSNCSTKRSWLRMAPT